MDYIKTCIEGVFVLEPKVFGDERGYFMETWRRDDFERGIGRSVVFVQDNESMSSRGVLRGLHYQRGLASQAKLVRVVSGCVLDVAVDLRRSSPTLGRHVAVELSGRNRRQLFIPRGFAHGFLVVSDEAVFAYKVDNAYAPEAECSIRFDDPRLAIPWPIPRAEMTLSKKDLGGVPFAEAALFD
ncbi:MAG: dTDP-4-dehydrorhamnose 3,5-epimerase [Prevotellaceae bacterium]|nr:dTDP-4-dehydrorhamnose 3,5-epimerase [Prevotellaceae bacterium]